MVDVKAAKRYSKALFALAEERGLVERIRADLRNACAIVEGTPELATFMVNPLVSHEAKEQLLARGLGEAVSAEFMDFLRLLVRRDRCGLLSAVCWDGGIGYLSADFGNDLFGEAHWRRLGVSNIFWSRTGYPADRQQSVGFTLASLMGCETRQWRLHD